MIDGGPVSGGRSSRWGFEVCSAAVCTGRIPTIKAGLLGRGIGLRQYIKLLDDAWVPRFVSSAGDREGLGWWGYGIVRGFGRVHQEVWRTVILLLLECLGGVRSVNDTLPKHPTRVKECVQHGYESTGPIAQKSANGDDCTPEIYIRVRAP